MSADSEEREGKLGGVFLLALLGLVVVIAGSAVVAARALNVIARAANTCLPAVSR